MHKEIALGMHWDSEAEGPCAEWKCAVCQSEYSLWNLCHLDSKLLRQKFTVCIVWERTKYLLLASSAPAFNAGGHEFKTREVPKHLT